MMYNDSEEISASEINRYVYCHYQWYYERLFGKKHLRMLYNERNKALGLEDSTKSNFAKGLKFHSEYRLRRGHWKLVLAAAVIAAIIFLLFYFGVFSL